MKNVFHKLYLFTLKIKSMETTVHLSCLTFLLNLYYLTNVFIIITRKVLKSTQVIYFQRSQKHTNLSIIAQRHHVLRPACHVDHVNFQQPLDELWCAQLTFALSVTRVKIISARERYTVFRNKYSSSSYTNIYAFSDKIQLQFKYQSKFSNTKKC